MILTTNTDASPNKTTMDAASIATMTRTYVFIITRNQKNSPVFSCTMCSGTMPEITFAGNESVSYVRLAMRPWSNGTIRNSVPAGPDWESSHVTSTAVQPSPVLTTFHACRLL